MQTPSADLESIRVWVTGCATGEEAYSIAMLLFESFAAESMTPNFQIFATDLSEVSLEVARKGIYSHASVANLSQERLNQFFVRVDEHHYRVNKLLRESVVFAAHNLVSDTPFSKLDLISCRNLLIYLEPEIQRKIISLFHFALRLNGYLVLGTSEAIGRAQDLFRPVSRKSRIFRRIGPRRYDLMELPITAGSGREPAQRTANRSPRPPSGVVEILNKLLLTKYAPAAVLMTRRYEVLSMQGPLVKFLNFPNGEPTRDLLAMARPGLTARIRAAVHAAIRSGQTASNDESTMVHSTDSVRCRITVTPVEDTKENEGLLLVAFKELSSLPPERDSVVDPTVDRKDSPLIEQLQGELKATSEDLQFLIEELEHSNEELRVSEEEALSMNEELQSSNEELESSREELQSLNEELSTANSQLQEKVEELDKANCDITNLMISAEIATLFLDDQLCIQRFTPPAARLLKLRDADAGRPLRDLASGLRDDSLLTDCEQVLRRHRTNSFESQRVAKDGRVVDVWVTITVISGSHAHPGVVATTERDITATIPGDAAAMNLTTLRAAEHYKVAEELQAVLDATVDAVITINFQGIIIRVNRATERMFGYSKDEAVGQNIRLFMTSPDRENHDIYLRRYQETGVPHIIGIGREVCCQRKDGTTFIADLSVSEVDHLGLFTGVIRDVSERRLLQNEILRAVSEEQRRIGQDLHDSAGQELAGLKYLIQGHLTLLEKSLARDLSAAETTNLLRNELETLRKSATVVKSLQQNIRSVIRGLAPVDINGRGLMNALTDLAAGISDLHQVQCWFKCPTPLLIHDNQQAIQMYRIAQESVNNAIRHGGASQIEISLKAAENNNILTITDNGCGFDSRVAVENGGFGLHIMNYRAALIAANLSIKPADGRGTIVRCIVPRSEETQTEESPL